MQIKFYISEYTDRTTAPDFRMKVWVPENLKSMNPLLSLSRQDRYKSPANQIRHQRIKKIITVCQQLMFGNYFPFSSKHVHVSSVYLPCPNNSIFQKEIFFIIYDYIAEFYCKQKRQKKFTGPWQAKEGGGKGASLLYTVLLVSYFMTKTYLWPVSGYPQVSLGQGGYLGTECRIHTEFAISPKTTPQEAELVQKNKTRRID